MMMVYHSDDYAKTAMVVCEEIVPPKHDDP